MKQIVVALLLSVAPTASYAEHFPTFGLMSGDALACPNEQVENREWPALIGYSQANDLRGYDAELLTAIQAGCDIVESGQTVTVESATGDYLKVSQDSEVYWVPASQLEIAVPK